MKNLLLFALTLAGAVPCFGQMIDPLDEVKTREKTLSNRIQKSIQWSYKYENGKPSKDGKEKASAGDTVLIPASLEQITLECHKNAEILEVYIK